jgi:hypothetical protein
MLTHDTPTSLPGLARLPTRKILRIGLVQGGRIIEEHLIAKPGPITIGQSHRNTIVLPSDALPRTLRLFAYDGTRYTLELGTGVTGTVSFGAEAPMALAEHPRLRRLGGSACLSLDARARGRIVLGDAVVLFQFVTAPADVPRPRLPAQVRWSARTAFDWALITLIACSMAAHFGLVAYLRAHAPRRAQAADDIPDRFLPTVVRGPLPLPMLPRPAPHSVTTTLARPKASRGQGRPGLAVRDPAPSHANSRGSLDDAARRRAVAERVAGSGVLQVLTARGAGGSLNNLLHDGAPDQDVERAP